MKQNPADGWRAAFLEAKPDHHVLRGIDQGYGVGTVGARRSCDGTSLIFCFAGEKFRAIRSSDHQVIIMPCYFS